MPKELNLEFKVGLFVLVAFVGLMVFIFSVSDSFLFEKGKLVDVIFKFANGLKKNAPVRVAGVEQGVVKKLEIFFDRVDSRTKVRIKLWLGQDIKIPIDSVVLINQLGLMGEKYIEIIPGVDTKKFLAQGQELIGKEPIAQEVISERIMEVATKLENTIVGVNKVIGSEKNIDSVEKTLTNLSMATAGLNELIMGFKKGEQGIGKILNDDRVYSIVETFENLSVMTTKLNDIIDGLSEGRGTVGKFLSDSQLYDNLEGFTADIKENPWKLLYRPKKGKRKFSSK